MDLQEVVPVLPLHGRNRDTNTIITDLEEANHWIENLSDFVWVFDLQFRSLRGDSRISRRMRPGTGDIVGQFAWESFSELTTTVWWEELRNAAEDRLPRRFEFFHPTWDLWLDCHIIPSHDRIAVVARDTTPRKNLLAALQDARRELDSGLVVVRKAAETMNRSGRMESELGRRSIFY